MVKKLHTNQSLLIALDLCQPHYQVLLITYLKLIKKKCKGCKEKRKIKSECDFIGIKNKLNYKCKECKKFANIHKFCNGDINKFVCLLRKKGCLSI